MDWVALAPSTRGFLPPGFACAAQFLPQYSNPWNFGFLWQYYSSHGMSMSKEEVQDQDSYITQSSCLGSTCLGAVGVVGKFGLLMAVLEIIIGCQPKEWTQGKDQRTSQI